MDNPILTLSPEARRLWDKGIRLGAIHDIVPVELYSDELRAVGFVMQSPSWYMAYTRKAKAHWTRLHHAGKRIDEQGNIVNR